MINIIKKKIYKSAADQPASSLFKKGMKLIYSTLDSLIQTNSLLASSERRHMSELTYIHVPLHYGVIGLGEGHTFSCYISVWCWAVLAIKQ